MFRILVTFHSSEPLLFTTSHFTTLDQVEQRFLTPLPWVITTEKGPITIDRIDPDLIIIEQRMGNRVIAKRTLTYKKSEIQMSGEELKKEDDMGDEAITPEVMLPEDSNSDEQKTALMTSEYTKFVSFREKFLQQSIEASSWEDSIIEKQAKYLRSLKRVDSELGMRQKDAEALEERTVGK